MAASFELQGALSEELFLRPACSGEMFVMLGKVYPILGEREREKLYDPESFLDVEKVATRSKWGRDRLKFIVKRLEGSREKLEKVKEEVTSGKGLTQTVSERNEASSGAKAPLVLGIMSRLKSRPTKPAGWRDGRLRREKR